MKYCKNCGKKIESGQKFCKHCGTKVGPIEPDTTTVEKGVGKTNFIKSKRTAAIVIGIVLLCAVGGAWFAYAKYGPQSHAVASSNGSTTPNNSQAVVDILCDNGEGGSGTIFTTTGTILTNNHVITGSTSCKVTIPNPATGQIAEIYEAAPVIVPVLSKKYDVATVQIDASYTDSNGKTWGAYPTTFTPFSLPSTCSTSTASKLGDSIRIYGYPVTSGGYNLTETDGIISSFADDGDILTSAKVDSGNSGGLAIDQSGCYLGIPSAVISGNYQNLGVIIPGNIVQQFVPNVPVKKDLVTEGAASKDEAIEEAVTPHIAAPVTTSPGSNAPTETPTQQCQATYGVYSQTVGDDASGEPLCSCQSGYAWSGDGNSCVAKSDLLAYCQDEFGVGSYSEDSGSTKSECACSTGYEWNTGETECVATSEGNDESCQDKYGDGSEWDGSTDSAGGPECDCQSGYVWNSDQTECVSQPSCPAFSTYNTSSGKCQCDTGYAQDGSICESDLEYCENTDGYGATYDSTTNSCECGSGYVSNGGTCESGYTYCEDEYGSNYEYDSLTNGCTPSSY